jgi:hypothetical protein
MAKPAAGIRQQGIDRSPAEGLEQLVHAFGSREIGFDGVHLDAIPAQFARRALDLRLIRDDHQIEAVLRAFAREFEADAGRSSGNDGERLGRVEHLRPRCAVVRPIRVAAKRSLLRPEPVVANPAEKPHNGAA